MWSIAQTEVIYCLSFTTSNFGSSSLKFNVQSSVSTLIITHCVRKTKLMRRQKLKQYARIWTVGYTIVRKQCMHLKGNPNGCTSLSLPMTKTPATISLYNTTRPSFLSIPTSSPIYPWTTDVSSLVLSRQRVSVRPINALTK